MKNDPNCIFCKIVKGEIPADVVYEDNKMIAFLDIKPVNLGHTLLIPKDHHPMFTDTPDEVIPSLFIKAKELMRTIKETVGADFVVLSIVGVDVPHLHLHLIPRFRKDGLENFWPTKQSEKNEQAMMARKLRASVKNKK